VTAQVRFANDSVAEHIWLENVRFDGQYVTGRLSEDAIAIGGVYRGQAVRVLPGELTDWMIVEDGWLCGGFSERVNAARRPAAEQEAWMKSFRLRGMPGEDEVCDERLSQRRR
jgi:uncharacterized protein YegJ (DUF2314 family)